jgi:hypothetical protein
MSADRAYRIWRKAGLQVPRRRPRRRLATGRPRPLPATGANQVWAYDFVFDASANGQQLKCLTVIDEFTDTSKSGGWRYRCSSIWAQPQCVGGDAACAGARNQCARGSTR